MSKAEGKMESQLSAIVAKMAQLDVMAKELAAMQEKLEKAMVTAGQDRVEVGNFSALRYESISYKPDGDALLVALNRFEDKAGLEAMMPRTPAVAKIREVIDGEAFESMRNSVRACCTRKTEWKLKIGKAKKKAEIVKKAIAAN